MEIFRNGTRVVFSHEGYSGTVVGYTSYHDQDRCYPVYLIKLDSSLAGYMQSMNSFISVIVVSADSVTLEG